MSKEIQVLDNKEIIFGLDKNGVLVLDLASVDDGAIEVVNSAFISEAKNNGNLLGWNVFLYDKETTKYSKLKLIEIVDGESARTWKYIDNAGTSYIVFILTFATGVFSNEITLPE